MCAVTVSEKDQVEISQAALIAAARGLEKAADRYGYDTTITLGQVISSLQKCADEIGRDYEEWQKTNMPG